MILPNEKHWLRVEELGEQLGLLPPDKIADRISQLEAAGESQTVLTLLGSWLALPPPPSPLQKGSVVGGRYTLLEKLGEGGMGSVWRAKQAMVARDVAVKMIHPALVTPALHRRFVSEMNLLGQLDHPGIVRIFDAGVHEHPDLPVVPFFAMELVEGCRLDLWAERHREEHSLLLEMGAGICRAVQSAHERRIVHRDLKPSNILVKAEGQPVVVDFGIARLSGMMVGEEAGTFSGTLQYAAPEQHLGRDLDFRSGESVDVFSIGAILFEIFSGRRLFDFPRNMPIAEMRRAVLEGPIPRLSEVMRNCPPMLDELIARSVRRDPEDRFYSVAALGRALVRAVERESPMTAPPLPWQPAAGAIVPGTQWKLATKMGEGGTGQVWLGVHEQLAMRRVFKFCATEEKARTLKRELTLYRLLKDRVGRNPHFIQLHEVSLDEPPWYLMMDETDAVDLEHWSERQTGGLAEVPESVRLEIVAQTAEALQTAHEAGILHRDIKPANLLIKATEPAGLVHVIIADFGIGLVVADEILRGGTKLGFTRTVSDLARGSLSGTILYIAPEVLEGQSATARSDIYSLGVVLWQLLIGNLTTALDPTNGLARVSDPLMRADLGRCLAGAPEQRWSSAGELAASLRALPDRRAAFVRQKAELDALERTAYRRGVMRTWAAAAVIIAVLAGLAWLAWVKSVEAERQRKAVAITQTRSALQELKGLLALKSGDARSRLIKQIPQMDAVGAQVVPELRAVADAILASPVFDPLASNSFALSEFDRFSDNGERLIAIDAGEQKPRVIDLSSEPRRVLYLSGLTNPPSILRVNYSGTVAGAIAADGSLEVWSGSDLSKASHLPGRVHAGCFAISPFTLAASKSTAVALAQPDGSVTVWLVGQSNAPLRLFRRSSETVDQFPESCPASLLAFSHTMEGILAAAGPASGNLLLWQIVDQPDQKIEGKLAGALWHPDAITCVGWNQVADEIATGCQDGVLRVWRFSFNANAPQTDPMRRADLGEPVRDLAWSPDGGLLAVLLDSGAIRLLPATAPDQRAFAALSFPGASHLAFAPGPALVAWGKAGTRAWGMSEQPVFAERRFTAGPVYVDFQAEGCLTATGPDVVQFLNPSTLARTGGFKSGSLHPAFWEGRSLWFDQQDKWKTAEVVPESAPSPWLRLPNAPVALNSVSNIISSAQGLRAAWIGRGRLSCRVGGRDEGAPVTVAGELRYLAVSDAAPVTAWVDEAGAIHVHDHLDRSERTFRTEAPVLGLAFAPEADLLACRTEAGVLFVNPQNLQQKASEFAAPGILDAPLAFSPDGQWLGVCGPDQSPVIVPVPPPGRRWENGGAAFDGIFTNFLPLRSPQARRVVCLGWNSTGSRLASGTADGFAQMWNVSLLREKLRLWKLDAGESPPPGERLFVPVRLN